jgi:hypothetical protein
MLGLRIYNMVYILCTACFISLLLLSRGKNMTVKLSLCSHNNEYSLFPQSLHTTTASEIKKSEILTGILLKSGNEFMKLSENRKQSKNRVVIYQYRQFKQLRSDVMNNFSVTLSYGRSVEPTTKQNKLHGLSPRANYTDRATAACRRSDCQLLRIEGATWSA